MKDKSLFEEYPWIKVLIKESGIWRDEKWFEKQITSPNWEDEKSRVHNWRNHIQESIKKEWNMLTMETKVVLCILAEMKANEEEWD